MRDNRKVHFLTDDRTERALSQRKGYKKKLLTLTTQQMPCHNTGRAAVGFTEITANRVNASYLPPEILDVGSDTLERPPGDADVKGSIRAISLIQMPPLHHEHVKPNHSTSHACRNRPE